jgi:hypothetical protein
MPTPVNHLVIAQDIVRSDKLSATARALLTQERGSFLFGSTAPDVQAVGQRPRHETHFYTFPPTNEEPAYLVLLTAYPELAHAERLTPPHSAFIAGYITHLLADEAWWQEVFNPFFGLGADWATWKERMFWHNVLRTYMDREDQARLGSDIGTALAGVEPQGWLPFACDSALVKWRDSLAEQLHPGRHIRTAEIFARRMHIAPQAIEEALSSPERLAQLFAHVPPQRLDEYRENTVRRSMALVNEYLHALPEP